MENPEVNNAEIDYLVRQMEKQEKACTSKKRYKTRANAWKNSAYFFTRFGNYNTPYKCKYCKKFHLTSKSWKPVQASKTFIREFNKWFGSQAL